MEDLFGVLPPAPTVPDVVPYSRVRYERIVVLNKPDCGHCQMVKHGQVDVAEPGYKVSILRARWRRISWSGSVLDLCDQHVERQQELDQAGADLRDLAYLKDLARAAENFRQLRDQIVAILPDDYDLVAGVEQLDTEVDRLAGYVRWLHECVTIWIHPVRDS